MPLAKWAMFRKTFFRRLFGNAISRRLLREAGGLNLKRGNTFRLGILPASVSHAEVISPLFMSRECRLSPRREAGTKARRSLTCEWLIQQCGVTSLMYQYGEMQAVS